MSVRETATRFTDAGGGSSVAALLGTNGRSKCAGSKRHAVAKNGTGKSGARKQNLQRIGAGSAGNSPIESAAANSPAVHSAQKGKSAQSKSSTKGKHVPSKSASSSQTNSPLPAVTGEEATGRVRKKPIIGSKKLKKEKTATAAPQPIQPEASSSQFDQFTNGRTVDRQPSTFTQSNYQVGAWSFSRCQRNCKSKL